MLRPCDYLNIASPANLCDNFNHKEDGVLDRIVRVLFGARIPAAAEELRSLCAIWTGQGIRSKFPKEIPSIYALYIYITFICDTLMIMILKLLESFIERTSGN